MQSKLEFLLEKYSVNTPAKLLSKEKAEIGGKETPLLPWRNCRKFIELKRLADTSSGISTMRTTHVAHKGEDLYKILYREIDIAQWILGTKAAEVFAITGGTALNAIIKMENDTVCTFELAATLPPCADVIDKHEIIAKSGVLCDMVVDTQVNQKSIYLFTEDVQETYLDVDAELYGLSESDCAVVRNAFDMAQKGYDFVNEAAALENVLAAAKKSIANCENVKMGGAF